MTDTSASLFESPAYRLQQAARTHRAFMLTGKTIAALKTVRAILLRAYERYRQHRKASGIRDVLGGLDDRTLRDIGIDRSEIASVAAELTGQTEASRMHPWRAAQEATPAWGTPAPRLLEPSHRDALRGAELRRQVLLALELEAITQAPARGTDAQPAKAMYSASGAT